MLKNLLHTLQFRNALISYRGGLHKTKAQSLVEFAITLPILILLFSGMIEFGFLLNTYLSLQDATRSAARYYANSTPFEIEDEGLPSQTIIFTNQFPVDVANFVITELAPTDPGYAIRSIEMDETRDNILISVISVDVDEEETPPTITTITRYPSGSEYYYRFNNASIPPSIYDDASIENYMTANGSTPVDSGLLIIEIYYSYEGTLGLPWTAPFFSNNNPAMLYASTIMPLVAAKP
ncbi:MAG TPA: hypothetical protein DEP19_08870 [Anaerolineae bacterium]|nr:hypothetical protein [Anaerolineae bacterium]HCK64682.1 hypothetical protein [Anaerolineae bacterium]